MSQDGKPFIHPSQWIQDINGPGTRIAERRNNCVDCARAVEARWRGVDATAAPHIDPEVGGAPAALITNWTGGKIDELRHPTPLGPEVPLPAQLDSLNGYLTESGPGSSAVVLFSWQAGGGHALNAVNHQGKILWIDGQTGKFGPWPPTHYPPIKNVSVVTYPPSRPRMESSTPSKQTGTPPRVQSTSVDPSSSFLPSNSDANSLDVGVTGPTGGRVFSPEEAGGPVQNLKYQDYTVTPAGIREVETHLGRFEGAKVNDIMIDRLNRIAAGTLEPTPADLRFYSHELRELERYRNLEIPDNIDPGYEVWNNAHSATLKDFDLEELDTNGNRNLYHEDAWQAVEEGATSTSYGAYEPDPVDPNLTSPDVLDAANLLRITPEQVENYEIADIVASLPPAEREVVANHHMIFADPMMGNQRRQMWLTNTQQIPSLNRPIQGIDLTPAELARARANGFPDDQIVEGYRRGHRSYEEMLTDLGLYRTPGRPTGRNEGLLVTPSQGLQSRTTGLFEDVAVGNKGDHETTYLWTIDDRGVNLIREKTPFDTDRGNVVHTNLSKRAAIGGEAWFVGDGRTVIINGGSGRFGDGAGISRQQWENAAKQWESLGYEVQAVEYGSR